MTIGVIARPRLSIATHDGAMFEIAMASTFFAAAAELRDRARDGAEDLVRVHLGADAVVAGLERLAHDAADDAIAAQDRGFDGGGADVEAEDRSCVKCSPRTGMIGAIGDWRMPRTPEPADLYVSHGVRGERTA